MKSRLVRAARKTSKWSLFIKSRRLYLNYCSNGVKSYTINLIKDRRENVTNQMTVSMRVRYSGVNELIRSLYKRDNFLDLIKLFPFITGEVYSLVEAIHDVCRGSVGVL